VFWLGVAVFSHQSLATASAGVVVSKPCVAPTPLLPVKGCCVLSRGRPRLASAAQLRGS